MSHIVSIARDKVYHATAKDGKIIHAIGKQRGIAGTDGTSSTLGDVVAGEDIVIGQPVYVTNDVAFLASNDDVPNFLNFAGLAKVGASTSGPLDIATDGPFEFAGWSWVVPGNIYLGVGGTLTQTPVAQVSNNVHRLIGEVISPTRIIIRIEEAIVFDL